MWESEFKAIAKELSDLEKLNLLKIFLLSPKRKRYMISFFDDIEEANELYLMSDNPLSMNGINKYIWHTYDKIEQEYLKEYLSDSPYINQIIFDNEREAIENYKQIDIKELYDNNEIELLEGIYNKIVLRDV